MTGFKCYTWQNEPILNIEQWAKGRGEMMVDVTRRYNWELTIPDTSTWPNRVRWFICRHIHVGHPPHTTETGFNDEIESIPDFFYANARLQDASKPHSVVRRDPR